MIQTRPNRLQTVIESYRSNLEDQASSELFYSMCIPRNDRLHIKPLPWVNVGAG